MTFLKLSLGTIKAILAVAISIKKIIGNIPGNLGTMEKICLSKKVHRLL